MKRAALFTNGYLTNRTDKAVEWRTNKLHEFIYVQQTDTNALSFTTTFQTCK